VVAILVAGPAALAAFRRAARRASFRPAVAFVPPPEIPARAGQQAGRNLNGQ
jgi:hypothetical protein